MRPVLQPGLSISNATQENSCGTLGLFVCDVERRLLLLTARHVLFGSSNRDVFQPGLGDGGSTPRHVARVIKNSFKYDAVLAAVRPNMDCSIEQFESGLVVEHFRAPLIGDELEKSGRTTGITRARVVDLAPTSPADIPKQAFRLEPLPGEIEPISSGGDSGAIWYDPVTKTGVGLHHGGEPGFAIAVRLTILQTRWNIKPWNRHYI